MKNGTIKRSRHEAIKRVIDAQMVSTQEELASLLGSQGIEVTQATLSRDLAQLGAVRVHRPDGPPFYELQSAPPSQWDENRMRDVGGMVTNLADNDALVVIRTFPGSANAVALAIDQARLPESLGTIAGDDTIFITPARGMSTRKLAKMLRGMLALGEPL